MFRCHSSAGPGAGVTSYLWNMENLGLSSDHDITVTDGTLSFHGTRYTGLFECYATSEHGKSYAMLDLESFIAEAEAESLTMVKGPARLTEAAAGSEVRVECEVESADPVTFAWTFNTDSIKSRPSEMLSITVFSGSS